MSAEPPLDHEIQDRAQPETFRARTLVASLTVNDLARSVEWYRDVVGFIVAEEYEHDGEVGGVSLKAGSIELMLSQDDGAQGMDRKKGVGFSLYLGTAQDVDEIADRIRSNGGTLLSEPADMPWGSRLFRIEDPDGFRLAIASESE
jgi:lactoylglutathione lyase